MKEPQKMYGWTDTRYLQSIQLHKTKKECVKAAFEYAAKLVPVQYVSI